MATLGELGAPGGCGGEGMETQGPGDMGTGRTGDEEGQGDENKQGWEHEGTELVNTLRR